MVYQYKLRGLVGSNSRGLTNCGITIPSEFAEFYGFPHKEIYFKFERVESGILLIPGSKIVPTKEEVEGFDLEKLRVI